MKKLMILFLSIAILGCHSKPMGEASDAEIRVQALRTQQGDKTLEYNVRIFPDARRSENVKLLSENMMYRVDSSFYLLDGPNRIYPESSEYVAGGVSGHFEYLIVFDDLGEKDLDLMPLIYQDKYINKKNYQIRFK